MIDAIKTWLQKVPSPTSWFGVVTVNAIVVLYYVLQAIPDRVEQSGKALGQAECVATASSAAVTATAAAASQVADQAKADIHRSTTVGAQRERARTRTESIYRAIDEEARHDPPNPVDQCVLPSDRLQRWYAANAGPTSPPSGPDQGRPASQHNAATPGAAPTEIGLAARPGVEPPPGGVGVPPTRGPALQPAQVPGD